jgi:hypothetical protein
MCVNRIADGRHPHHTIGDRVGLDLGRIVGLRDFEIARTRLARRTSAAA